MAAGDHRGGRPITIGLVWAQFAAYHIDRCEAVARRFEGRATVLAVEVATTSSDYAWEPSGAITGGRKVTLFPGKSFDQLSNWQRFRGCWAELRQCDWVCIGLSYAELSTILLVVILRLSGKRMVVFSESKLDDKPRNTLGELAKRLILWPYNAAIVGATRHIAYFRMLGFRRRAVLPGYDGVGLDRVRAQGGGQLAPGGRPFEQRDFVFVGRFVDKKNLPHLVESFARYVAIAGAGARRLVLVGSGPDEPALRAMVGTLGLADQVEFPGFLPAGAVSRCLADALALVLPSVEEQWGLVVNEALAFGLPVIVSHQVGSRDALVRDGVNGHVVTSDSVEQLAQAMHDIASDRGKWEAKVAASHQRAWLGDCERLADALELLIEPQNAHARANVDRFLAQLA
ncbi:glycosyltransferase [Novosphingobium sp.]|uniref:glycosyltransferase n=1 Tax=Novosphingobium sp. TaxID=1874826 RepID=UPI0025E4469E|nr:glycosyltransferase [Novosphingobium sp.]